LTSAARGGTGTATLMFTDGTPHGRRAPDLASPLPKSQSHRTGMGENEASQAMETERERRKERTTTARRLLHGLRRIECVRSKNK